MYQVKTLLLILPLPYDSDGQTFQRIQLKLPPLSVKYNVNIDLLTTEYCQDHCNLQDIRQMDSNNLCLKAVIVEDDQKINDFCPENIEIRLTDATCSVAELEGVAVVSHHSDQRVDVSISTGTQNFNNKDECSHEPVCVFLRSADMEVSCGEHHLAIEKDLTMVDVQFLKSASSLTDMQYDSLSMDLLATVGMDESIREDFEVFTCILFLAYLAIIYVIRVIRVIVHKCRHRQVRRLKSPGGWWARRRKGPRPSA